MTEPYSKLPGVGTTIFTVMSALAEQHRAINLGQGFPDYPMDDRLIDAVTSAMRNGYNQYAAMQGFLPLREAIAEKVFRSYGTSINPGTQIAISPGATNAIYTALTVLLRPGDEVILFEPAYDSYIPGITVNGAVPVAVNLEFPGYRINWERVRQQLTGRTRAIIINSPHNPTGAVLTASDIQELRSIVACRDMYIISDEVYEHLIYDELPHQSLLRYPDLLQQAFVCFSFGKLYHCTGWKIGYCISSPALMKEYLKLHQYLNFSCHTPSQVALNTLLRDPSSYEALGRVMQQKRDYFRQLMASSLFTPLPSHGGYFQCFTYENISAEPAANFAIRLTQEYGVASVPVSAFYQSGKDDRVIRFCFAKKEATLAEAATRLARVCAGE